MNAKKIFVIVGVVTLILAVITGLVIKNFVSGPVPAAGVLQSSPSESSEEPLDAALKVAAVWSKVKANTVALTVNGLGGKVSTLAYEFSYESGGLIKGVNSGSNKIDVSGKDSFTREVYLGTCSKNDCRPDAGVGKVSVVVEFNNTDGKKSQFTGDFSLTGNPTVPASTQTSHPVTD